LPEAFISAARSYLINASNAQGLCSKPIQNARILQVEPVARLPVKKIILDIFYFLTGLTG
jgi:hypothetical protein